MNELEQKIHDVIKTLEVKLQEIKDIENQRIALENSQLVASQRDEKLNDRELSLVQRERDVTSQKKYIEDQNISMQTLVAKIQREKKELAELVDQKRQLEKDRLQLELDKKGFESLLNEKQKFEADKVSFEHERDLFIKEKKAHYEAQQLFAIREKNLKQKEERMANIERMTGV